MSSIVINIDTRSDDSDMEQANDDEAALLAATFAGNDNDDDGVEVMDDDSGDDDDIPTINIGGEEYDITDVPEDLFAKMTPEEIQKYNQLYQDFYKDMYA